MPVHDWTLVTPGTFHDFHLAWIVEIRRALNGGLLPEGYYALAEQVAGEIGPDILTLQDSSEGSTRLPRNPRDVTIDGGGGTLAVADAPPKAAVMDTVTEAMLLAMRHRRLVICHTTGDRIVAILEIVSQGNKQGRLSLDSFVEKAISAMDQRYHLQVIDLFPPGPYDPQGIHGAIWQRFGAKYEAPPDKPLTVASYRAFGAVTAYVEPVAIGDHLPEMPLFLDNDHYIRVPLERTYQAAWEGVPFRWRRVLDRDAKR